MKTKTPFLLLVMLLTLMAAHAQKKDEAAWNKAQTVKIYKAFDSGDVNALDNLISSNPIEHGTMPSEIKSTGLQAVKDMSKMQKEAFPDMKTTIHTMATAGDTVIAYYTSEGTNSGPFMGRPATNKHIKVDGVDIIRFENGKAVEHWAVNDNLSMMQQMGMMPPPPPPTAGTGNQPDMHNKQ